MRGAWRWSLRECVTSDTNKKAHVQWAFLLTDLYNLPKNINRFKLDKVLIYSKPFYLKYYINDILLSIGIILIIFLIMIKPINYFSITH